MSPPEGMTIGQVSQRLGVPVPTLRSWHRRYGVALPARTTGGHRRYGTPELETLQALSTAVARGIAPRTAVQALRGGTPSPGVPLSLLERFLEAAAACDSIRVRVCLDEAEQTLGLEPAVDRLLIPALREIGLRWELGTVGVDVEHVTTGAVRAWIASRTGKARLRAEPPVLVAAGPGNRHTVALEAFTLLLDRRGRPTRLLGEDTPVAAVLAAFQTVQAAAAVLTAQQLSRSRGTVEALRALRDAGHGPLFYAGAAFDSPRRRRDVPGSYLGTDLPAAADAVERSLAPA